MKSELDITVGDYEGLTLEKIEKEHLKYLTKNTASWIVDINKIISEDNTDRHLKIGSLFGLGNLLFPQAFLHVTFGYMILTQLTYVSFLLKVKKRKDWLTDLKVS